MAGEPVALNGGIYPRGFSASANWRWPLVKSEQLVTLNYGKALRAGDRQTGQVPVYGTNGQCGWHDTPLANGPGVILGRKGQGPLGVEWCDCGLLQYIDLTLWSMEVGTSITNKALASGIFPNNSEKGEENIRTTTKKHARAILEDNIQDSMFIPTLRAYAQFEVLSEESGRA